MKKSKILFGEIVALSLGIAFGACKTGTSTHDSSQSPLQITVTEITGTYKYAKINLCPEKDFGYFVAGTGQRAISKGVVSGALYTAISGIVTVSEKTKWYDEGEYYITLTLLSKSGDSGILFVYTDGAAFDYNNILPYHINTASLIIPFDKFKAVLPGPF
jgi:hypothetical protein